MCKQIPIAVTEMAHRSVDRSRLAQLPTRLLEDIGMTLAERDARLR